MKKSILIGVMAVALFTACGQANSKKDGKETASAETTVQSLDASVVNVYYFHGKQRCKTCIAVGNVTEETIKDFYTDNSSVKFIEVDTSLKENEALVEKYEVSWNALIIAKGDNSINITERAFASAINSPEVLTSLIKEEVNNRLK